MAKMETKEVFDLYFKTIPQTTVKKIRSRVDRAEVYEYEKKLGKQIFDMDVDELFGLILSYSNIKALECRLSATYSSLELIISTFRSIWNYYIDNIDVIRNPWNDKRMRGTAASLRISEANEPFTLEILEDAIKKVYNDYSDGDFMPKYIECILRMFYDGFAEASEIVLLKEEMINFEKREVRFSGKTVHLSDRCFELLQYVHGLDKIVKPRGTFKLVPYHDGYFKFVVRPNAVYALQERSVLELTATIVARITRNIKQKHNIDINYRTVYLLGFYNYIVGKIGVERTKELIISVRDIDNARELMQYAREYGVVSDNVTYIKKMLWPFI